MALVHRAVADPAAQHHAEDHLKDLEEEKKMGLTFLQCYDKNTECVLFCTWKKSSLSELLQTVRLTFARK